MKKMKKLIEQNIKIFEKILIIFLLFFIGFYSKSINIERLSDKELIGPDPYLLYRYTKQLYETGKILYPDPLRYYPFGIGMDNKAFISYVGYFFLKLFGVEGTSLLISFLNLIDLYPSSSFPFLIIQLTPAILFGISMIVFYFLAKEILGDETKAYISALIFALLPAITSRIMAGLYEKESLGLLFILISLYFYVKYNKENKILWIVLSGISSAFAAISWGGWVIIPLIIGLNEILKIIYYDNENFNFLAYLCWIPLYLFLLHFLFYEKNIVFVLKDILSSLNIIPFYFAFLYIIFNKIFKRYFGVSLKLGKCIIPSKFLTFTILIIAGSVLFYEKLIFFLSNPFLERFVSSIEEFQPPTYVTWIRSIGLPLLGFLYLYYLSIFFKNSKNIIEKIISVTYPAIFLTAILFMPKTLIFINWILFAVLIILHFIIVKKNTLEFVLSSLPIALSNYMIRLLFYSGIFIPIFSIKGLEFLDDKVKIDRKYMYLFLLFLPLIPLSFLLLKSEHTLTHFFINFLGRIIFSFYFSLYDFRVFFISVLIPFSILFVYYIKKSKCTISLILPSLLLFGIPFVNYGLLFNLFSYSFFTSGNYGKAWITIGEIIDKMTEKDAIFAHWWDYGYLIQTLGNRATILDGGNAIVYWNHLMGRYVLCGNKTTALKFLYSHTSGKPTYLLIDPTDLGKFYQFSRLGSDLEFDKLSNLGSYVLRIISGNTLIFEPAGPLGVFSLDEDLIINNRVIRRCIPDKGIIYPKCGVVSRIIIYVKRKFDELYYDSENNLFINLSKVVRVGEKIYLPKGAIIRGFNKEIVKAYNNISDAEIIINYMNEEYRVKLKCIYLNGKRIYYNEKGYGCLYLVKCDRISGELCGYFISNKAMNYLWIRLYFFNDYQDTFKLIFSSGELYMHSPPWKIWKVIYPKGFNITEKERCLYLARNLEEINECVKKYGGKLYSSIWEV